MADTSIRISLELADKAAQKALTDIITKSGSAEKGLQQIGSSGKSSFDGLSVSIGKSLSAFDVFSGSLAAGVAMKGLELLGAAASKAFDVFVVKGVEAAIESENALNSLNVALGLSGQYSAEASSDFQAFAKQIQATTTIEDDAVIKNASLIESLTQLDQQGLKRATSAAIELSQALGKDLASTSEIVAKAANGNFTAIQKLGFQFEKGATNAETFENALSAIENKLGGSAASKLNTYSGALEQTKNIFGDLQEEIGNVIVQNPVVTAAMNGLTSVFGIFSDVIKDNEGTLKGLVGTLTIGVIDAIKIAADTFNYFYKLTASVFHGIEALVYGTFGSIFTFFGKFNETSAAIGQELVSSYEEASKKIQTAFDANTIDDFSLSLSTTSAEARAAFDAMESGASKAEPAIKNAAGAVRELGEEQNKVNDANKSFAENLAKQSASEETEFQTRLENLKTFYALQEDTNAEADAASFENKLIREQEYFDARQTILDEQLEAELARVDQAIVSDDTKDQAKLALQAKYNQESSKLTNELALKEKSIAEAEANFKKKTDEKMFRDRMDVLGDLTQLQNSSSKEMVAIGKAAAITEIGINTYKGAIAANAALAGIPFVGPALGIAAAAAISLYGAERAAKVAGLSFAEGGIVPGSSFSGDRVSAQVNSGEMVLNKRQQARLFEISNGAGNSSSDRVDRLAAMVEGLINRPIEVIIDGKAVFASIRNQQDLGRAF
jgi:hypothetical protein